MDIPDKLALWAAHPAAMVREMWDVTLDGWQEEALEAFPHTRRLALKACKGPGKAQPKSTIIPTPYGHRRLGDLVVGDEVFTGDGAITTVRAVYERGVLPVFRVEFDDGSSTRACAEHLWKVKGRTERRHNRWSILSTAEIIARGVREKNGRWAGRHFEIPRQGALQCPRRPLPIDPYVLGVWLGDGTRLKPCYTTKPTPEIAAEIHRRGFEMNVRGKTATIYGLTPRLRAAGIFQLHSCDRFVPNAYHFAAEGDRKDLLCGLMDTDGGIDADGHMEFSSTSGKLAADVIWLARSLGGVGFLKAAIKRPYYRTPNGEIVHGKPCYRVTLCLPFNPFRIASKAARWKNPLRTPAATRYLTRKIDDIRPDGAEDCRCIEVADPSRLYLTNDCIVTHNSAVLAWLGWNFLITRPHPLIACTSISGDNLKTNLWTELARWYALSPFLQAKYDVQKTQIVCRDHPKTWKLEARSWSKDADAAQIGNALAGVHAKYVMWLLDETGDYPTAIMPTCEGIFQGEPVEAHIVQAGNPTRLDGPLYRACTIARNLWKVIEITADPDDPKRTSRVSKEIAREQIEQYGRDNPWVLVNIFGQFPPSSLNALIGPDEVGAAMKKYYREDEITGFARVLGVDVAQYGDDQSVACPRQGIQMFPMLKWRNVNSLTGAGAVARKWDDWGAQATFIDNTGGFGAGWIDQLSTLGKAAIGIHFSGEAHNKSRYFNKRAEMYFDFVEWIKRGGALPDDPRLLAALTQTTYTFKGDKLLLEPKDQVKIKLGYSPDEADAGALTFAEPVLRVGAVPRRTTSAVQAYSPFADLDRQEAQVARMGNSGYDPFRD